LTPVARGAVFLYVSPCLIASLAPRLPAICPGKPRHTAGGTGMAETQTIIIGLGFGGCQGIFQAIQRATYRCGNL